MKKFSTLLLAAVCFAVPAIAQNTNVVASHLESDLQGDLLTGKLCLTPVLKDHATAFSANSSAQVAPIESCYSVTAGVLNITVPDTNLANPPIGYKAVVKQANGLPLYSYSQPIYPTGSTWSLDAWAPAQIANVTTPTLQLSTSAPTGDCGSAVAVDVAGTIQTGLALYACASHQWDLIQGSGSGGNVQADWNATTGLAVILNKPTLAAVATSGSYADLSNKPTIPAAQINSDWNSVAGLSQILNKPALAPVATTGSYSDLLNKPSVPAAQVNSDWSASTGLAAIINKPALATVATTGSYADLLNLPSFSTVATTGSYTDLLNKPTIPAAQVQSDWNASTGLASILNKPALAPVATSGSYTDLTSKPSIPAAQVNSDWSSVSGLSQILNKPTLATVATSGSYPDLSNKPTIPAAVSIDGNTGAFTFGGTGVTHTGNAYTFTNSGGSMVYPAGSGIPVVSGGAAWGTTLAVPSGFGFMDATSSVQTQLNGKQASLGFTAVPNTTTVNGHALSSAVTISASDLTTGTLPHAQLPALVSADIPANTANTSGSAGSLSAASALPSGTTATTQTSGDNSTKVATTAYANTAATAAQTAAQTYASNASNLSSGTVPMARLSLPLSCEPGLGDGLNAIPAGTYLTTTCRNDTGQTWTITSIKCVADSGSSTCNVTNGAGTALLSGAIAGTSTYASGTQSGTTTIASGDYLKITFVADGTSKQIGIDVAGTY